MKILDQLASSLNRRDEIPNQELAKKIAASNNSGAVKELICGLDHKDKNIQSDCIKTLDEIAKLKPQLLSGQTDKLLTLLGHKNNRMQWGAMATLNAIASEDLVAIYRALPEIIGCADRGSVITNDHCVGILVKLCAANAYQEYALGLLNERLLKSPTNQLPMYAENVLPVIDAQHRAVFRRTLMSRLSEIDRESKRKRVEKVIKKLQD